MRAIQIRRQGWCSSLRVLCDETNSTNQARRSAAIEAKMLSNPSLVLSPIPGKNMVRAQSRSSAMLKAVYPATAARMSNEKPPATAIPAIASDTGARPSSPVITITPTTKKCTSSGRGSSLQKTSAPRRPSHPLDDSCAAPHNLPITARMIRINNSSPSPPLG